MKIHSADFITSAPDLETCPLSELPEFAFIGRSNVGKSSLINMLTAKKELAKTSSTPGKTRLINYFLINGAWCLVDLPGYGYAKVSKGQITDFADAVGNYLIHRENLKSIFVLIDSRIEPMEIDLQFIAWLVENERPVSLVFTKAEKSSKASIEQTIELFQENLSANNLPIPDIFYTSAKSGSGKGILLQHIDKLLPKAVKSTKKKSKNMASLKWAKKFK